jgi:predicted Rossmann fold nucleotide-binding protein DprA/Smf involved in DNA uptake
MIIFKKPMRVIIAGSRYCTDRQEVLDAIRESGFKISTVISGCARGVDTIGEALYFEVFFNRGKPT